MKRVALTVLVIMFLCLSVSTNVWATAFSIIDGTFEIAGEVSYWDDGSHTVGQYYQSSTSPVTYRIDDTIYQPAYGGYQQSTASWSNVDFEAFFFSGDIGATGTAKSTVRFMSAFDGILGKDILFYGLNDIESGPAPSWTLTDLTAGNILELNSPDLPGEFSQPLVQGVDFNWDSTHVYELELFVTESTDFPHEQEFLATNMFAVNVPEPATIIFLGTGLLGLVCTSRKKFKK
jgi:hypothetical protein